MSTDSNARFQVVATVAALASTAPDWDDVLGPTLRALREQASLHRPALGLLDSMSGVVALEAAHGLTPGEIRRARYALGEGVTGRVAQHGVPAVVGRVRDEPHYVDQPRALKSQDVAFVCVPVWWRSVVIGTLSAHRDAPDPPDLDEDRKLLEAVAALLAPWAQRLIEDRGPVREAGDASFRPDNLIGRSKPMRATYLAIDQVASSSTSVLIQGETGTGKELVASAIHRRSDRSRRRFVAVNCAALPESVIESELFGHERGAFTGALEQRKGRFELADGGTLFLDEIGDLSASSQVKLLRVLQERRFERVGGSRAVEVDVRVIAATSRDLDAMIEAGDFRADLFWRLSVFPIRVPPLRERRSDVILLADHFVEKFARAHGKRVERISTPAIDMLTAYHWPGNVRELENCVERAVLLARDGVVHGHHLPPSLQTGAATGTDPATGLEQAIAALERDMLGDALKATRGNIAAAARMLGVTERIMGLRLKKRGVDPKRFRTTKT